MEQLNAYTQKIEKVVDEIFEDHLEEMLQLAALAAEVELRQNSSERLTGYHELCYKHLFRRDVQLALYYWHKIDDQNPLKLSCLPGIISCLLKKNQLAEAYHYFHQYEAMLPYKEHLSARFALIYIEQDNRPMLELMLEKLTLSKIKQFVLYLASSRYPGYAQEIVPGELENPMSEDELIGLARLPCSNLLGD